MWQGMLDPKGNITPPWSGILRRGDRKKRGSGWRGESPHVIVITARGSLHLCLHAQDGSATFLLWVGWRCHGTHEAHEALPIITSS